MFVVNLFGAPGSGKSTLADAIFAELKRAGVNCELVTEYAKDLTWEGDSLRLQNQWLIMGEQVARLDRLNGLVDVAITDSPLLMQSVYADALEYPKAFRKAVNWQFSQYDNMNFLVERKHRYSGTGRNQNETEAAEIHERIVLLLLLSNSVDRYRLIPSDITPSTITDAILKRLRNGRA